MSIKFDKHEDGRIIISEDDFKSLKDSSKNNFDNGYGKGQEAGKKEVLKHFSFLELDESNLEAAVKPIKQKLTDLNNGKIPDEIIKDLQNTDLVKDLQTKLQQKSDAYDALENNTTAFKRMTLIDKELVNLGGRKESLAIDPGDTSTIFQSLYKIEIGEGDKITVKNNNGNAIFNDKGEELTLSQVYDNFVKDKPQYFKVDGAGGSGGGSGNGGQGSITNTEFMSKTPKERAALMESGITIQP